MSAIAELFLATDSYSSVAERYITETRDLRTPGRTIAQSRQVFSILRALSLRAGTCGSDGYFIWLFHGVRGQLGHRDKQRG